MTQSTRSRMRGFTMVETLVALVVLGVGMLGIAGLYVTTLRASGSAISRMQAVNLASDLADRIRANRNAGENYAKAATDTPTNQGCVGGSTNCTPQQMAETDLYWWDQQISRVLPAGATGVVAVAAGNPRTYTITISWTEPGDSSALSYVLRMQI